MAKFKRNKLSLNNSINNNQEVTTDIETKAIDYKKINIIACIAIAVLFLLTVAFGIISIVNSNKAKEATEKLETQEKEYTLKVYEKTMKLESVNKELETKEAEINSKNNQITKKDKEIEDLGISIVKLNDNIQLLVDSIEEKDNQIANKQNELDLKKQELESSENDKLALNNQINDLTIEIESLKQERNGLLDQKTNLETSVDEKEILIGQLTNDKEALIDQIDLLNDSIDTLTSDKLELQNQLEAMTDSCVVFYSYDDSTIYYEYVKKGSNVSNVPSVTSRLANCTVVWDNDGTNIQENKVIYGIDSVTLTFEAGVNATSISTTSVVIPFGSELTFTSNSISCDGVELVRANGSVSGWEEKVSKTIYSSGTLVLSTSLTFKAN